MNAAFYTPLRAVGFHPLGPIGFASWLARTSGAVTGQAANHGLPCINAYQNHAKKARHQASPSRSILASCSRFRLNCSSTSSRGILVPCAIGNSSSKFIKLLAGVYSQLNQVSFHSFSGGVSKTSKPKSPSGNLREQMQGNASGLRSLNKTHSTSDSIAELFFLRWSFGIGLIIPLRRKNLSDLRIGSRNYGMNFFPCRISLFERFLSTGKFRLHFFLKAFLAPLLQHQIEAIEHTC